MAGISWILLELRERKQENSSGITWRNRLCYLFGKHGICFSRLQIHWWNSLELMSSIASGLAEKLLMLGSQHQPFFPVGTQPDFVWNCCESSNFPRGWKILEKLYSTSGFSYTSQQKLKRHWTNQHSQKSKTKRFRMGIKLIIFLGHF